MNQFDTYDSGAINPQDQYDPRVAQVLRGKNFLDAEPLSNAEVESILEERVNYLQRSNYAVPSTIADTLKDLSDVLRNMDTAYDHAGTQSRKEKLESLVFDGDKGPMKLDPVEVCQILNLNPRSILELMSYLPTLKRFSEYDLSRILDE
ncbi:uncharacterized protein [Blastocystis hominis]|uniref:RNA polymerase Rpb4/RPC9 core domain-containing protein n=1 Tax=Blastocystis hominis TaxID=12968 RepID=D8LWB7_BLAHO|nr:uncharacterized protein [Blastocystis hominis]CBK20106.2 unnamed protein product [Blastocystis hominis]|eukprot:XP_012894154.1 uncharacterized protein [Blastocystis hominis]